MKVYEDPDVLSVGTVLPKYNFNRNSSNAALALFYHTPSVIVGIGSEMIRQRLNPVQSMLFGSGGDGLEFILKPNMYYLIEVFVVGSVKVNTNFVFYEVAV
jgi:hypothetical protein